MGTWPNKNLTADQCRKTCEGTIGCSGWWSYNNPTKDCYISGGTPTLSSDTSTTRTIGICLDQASSCPRKTTGNLLSFKNSKKLGNWPNKGLSASLCESSCQETTGCSAWWSYDNTGKDCYMATGNSIAVETDENSTRTVGTCQ